MEAPKPTSYLPFQYAVIATVPASGSVTVTITTGQDSVFELHRYLSSTDAEAVAGDVSANRFKVEITNTTSGRALTNGKIPQRCIAPTDQPIDLRRPAYFPPSTTLSFTFTNLTVTILVIDFVLDGAKIMQGN